MIPSELVALRQWVCWKYETRGGKKTKVPVTVAGRPASSTNKATWTDYETASAAAKDRGFDGIGFVFTTDDPYCGIDLDHCIESGKIADWASTILVSLGGYAEVSPSGSGVKVWVRATLGDRKGRHWHTPHEVEVYDRGRFFTVTGDSIGSPATIPDAQDALDALYSEYDAAGPQKQQAATLYTPPAVVRTDADILNLAARAKNGAKFAALWAGDASAYPSRSEADMALASILAFYCGPNPDHVRSLMQQSGLRREKWDRSDYLDRTIKTATGSMTEFYSSGSREEPITNEWLESHGMGVPHNGLAVATQPRMQIADDEPEPRSAFVVSNIIDAVKQTPDGPLDVTYCKPLTDLTQELYAESNDWPRTIGGVLCVPSDDGGTRDLLKPAGLFAWLHEKYGVRWSTSQTRDEAGGFKRTPPTKEEFFQQLKDAPAMSYECATKWPHHSPIDGIYYAPVELPKATGARLAEFIDALNPQTEMDRKLMLAALLTCGWGGPTGARPIFVFSSDHGQGSGKTATATAIGDVFGPVYSLDYESKWSDIAKSIMSSAEGRTARVFLFDNMKGKFGGSALEAAVTARRIIGHRMFVGPISRMNDAVIFVTFNLPKLTTDIARRAVVIKIGKPKHDFPFVSWAREFVAKHRLELIADVMAMLRGPAVSKVRLVDRDRWQEWQDGVLCKIPDAEAVASHIIAERDDVDEAADSAMEFAAAMDAYAGDREQITSKDIHAVAVKAGVWQDSPSMSVQAQRSNCVKRVRRLLSGRGLLEPLKSKDGREVRARVYNDKMEPEFVRVFVWTRGGGGEADEIGDPGIPV